MKPSDPAGQLRVNVLGAIELVVDGDVVAFTSPRLRHLLAVLVAHSDSVVSADRLVDIIWPDDDERQAIRTLRTNVWRLRNLMGPAAEKALLTRPGGYVIDTRECAIDADRFEAIAEDATARLGAGNPPGAVEQFDAALALWRGEPYAGYADEDWARPVAVRLTSLREAAGEHRIEALLASGRSDEAIADLAELITRDPFRERLQAMYMKALYRDGRQAEALRAYSSYRSRLGEELGVEPSAELRLLEQSMLTGDPIAVGSTAIPIARGYELFGAVDATPATVTYRARGPRAAIDVMVTIVDRSIAGDVAFARAFEVGAQRMCGVAHPGLVPVVDCWRDVDGAYFVSPADRWGERHPGHVADEARFAHVVDQVCSAVHHLHLHGLHHGALGSESIRVDAEGNVMVSLGGLALGLHGGSARTDLHDLAAWLGTIVPLDVASAVDPALTRARADHVDDRFESVAELADAVFAVTRGSAPSAAAAMRNPYLGLRPFDEADADVFFGRGRVVKAILDRLAEPDVRGRFVAVVGASGSGKSSLVQAGVIPALRDGGTGGSADWYVARMAPGDHPFDACRSALDAVAIRPLQGAAGSANTDVLHHAHESLPPGSTLLLVIDQFEELFSSRVDASERRDFLDMVTSAITDPATAVRVIVTMRADFYDRPLQHPRFGQLFHRCQVVVTTLVDDEVAEAISGPADIVGLDFDAGLVRSLVRDFDSNPSLPLLQHALAELFDRRDATVATIEAYDSIGGLAGGIAHRAEAL